LIQKTGVLKNRCYDYFMIKVESGSITKHEIGSQSGAWKNTLHDLGKLSVSKLPDPEHFDRLVFTGCGSTYYLSVWAARLLVENGYSNAIALPASELCYGMENWLPSSENILLVPISRSGTTTETLQAVDDFNKRKNGKSMAVICKPGSKLAEQVDHIIHTPHGQEKGVALTRAFTTMMLALIWWIKKDIPDQLPGMMERTAEKLLERYGGKIKEIACNPGLKRFYYLGNSRLYGLVQDMMLTQQEMAHDTAEAYHFMEFRHGPRTFADPSALLLGISQPQSQEWETRLLQDMHGLGARILTIGVELPETIGFVDWLFDVGNSIPAPWRDVLYVLLLQLFSYERALFKGIDPDTPRNLSLFVKL
jgi:glucosamine--fructose-6-phosphate aminotransferase (isomerizing)